MNKNHIFQRKFSQVQEIRLFIKLMFRWKYFKITTVELFQIQSKIAKSNPKSGIFST